MYVYACCIICKKSFHEMEALSSYCMYSICKFTIFTSQLKWQYCYVTRGIIQRRQLLASEAEKSILLSDLDPIATSTIKRTTTVVVLCRNLQLLLSLRLVGMAPMTLLTIRGDYNSMTSDIFTSIWLNV